MRNLSVFIEISGFTDAMNRAKEELINQGFEHVENICKMIMEKGGISKVLM